MLRVFSPTQAKSVSEDRYQKDAIRAKALVELTAEINDERNKAEKDFEETMQRQKDEAAAWFDEHVTRKNKLFEEVERLEERRRIALIPPLIRTDDIHSVQEELWAHQLEVDLKESENEETSRLLMRRLDEVSSREYDLDERQKRIKIQEEGARIQQEHVTTQSNLLTRRMVDFEAHSSEKEADFARSQSELDARKNLLDEREQGFVKREEEIEASTRLLQDRRVMLDKGFEELRRLKEKYGSRDEHTNRPKKG